MSADNWDRQSHPMKKNQYGVFEITVPAKDGNVPIPHGSKVKVRDWTLSMVEDLPRTNAYSLILRFHSPCPMVRGQIAFRHGSNM